MLKIKFCGLFRECDIDYANALKPDFVGFIFVEHSKRFVDFATAQALKSRLDSRIKAVGVFVDSPVERIMEALSEGIIDAVQLHGSEDNAYISALKACMQSDLGKESPIIKAIKISDSHSLAQGLESSAQCGADFILLDSPNAGSGRAFDWNALAQRLKKQDFTREFQTRFFLAGGVNVENIQSAIALKPFCIDISSGIESNRVKDFAKMQTIINAVRS
ncbi:phosphoribosylanthranilate isomerase [Helicobacter macacae]|uniref:N-(5'-phosphoribosyl)anthranilate isomerase n=1 Tax=Helicobacter macacae MIT 99-5501 TaxID=1357400 RepID=V8CAX7_9HELI|nr:phosphoribosylanthranilate isomerase [Helicobacter macacae]ETD24262.1 hypothetical protein HMPREF2086_01012 [Helicobacter macacae MIT 99-5501]